MAASYAGSSTVGWFPLGWNEPYLPPYRASANYARQINLNNTYLTATYLTNNLVTSNYRTGLNQTNAVRFANQQVMGAVTMVSNQVFSSGAPVAPAARTFGRHGCLAPCGTEFSASRCA